MDEKNNNSCKKSPVPSRPSFAEILETVKKQVDYDSISQVAMKNNPGRYRTEPLYAALCRIIADMYAKPPASPVKIEGAWLEAYIVQERYRELGPAHIQHVVENFQAQTALITKLKPYLQNMLFNVVDEYDAYFTNLVNHDMHCGRGKMYGDFC